MSRTKEARLDCLMGLARAAPDPEAISINETNIIDSVVGSLTSCLSADDIRAITFEEIKAEVARDQEMLDLIKAIENKDVTDKFPDVVANYNRHRDNLLVVDGVPMLGRRVIVPASCRKRVLESSMVGAARWTLRSSAQAVPWARRAPRRGTPRPAPTPPSC